MMPKGGVLHIHNTAMTSIDWVIKTFTYLPDVYTRVENGSYPTRLYTYASQHPGSDWTLVSDLRARAQDPKQFDESLIYEMSIWSEDPFLAYPTVNDVWKKFRNYFTSLGGLLKTSEHYRMYFEQALKEFYEDGVQYIEIKTTSTSEEFLIQHQNFVDNFKSKYADFIGVKLIIGGRRSATNQRDIVNKTLELMKKYPNLIKGFDLLSQEDINHWTVEFADDLLKDNQSRLPYFFHAGETDWTQWVDFNLVDSVLMNASRIGHGYGVYHHPKVLEAVLKKHIAVELNPISNQVLGLVNDLRNHPGAYLFAIGAPVVISSDDPASWLAGPLSHDFYMAFMALGAVHDDLRLLKQLAINSITYSTMTDEEKAEAMTKWQRKWDEFIDVVVRQFDLK
ncbi:adenosine deaminase 2 [Biomphalaria pfeifferi]|uniref:adenosine deaminase n=1 Tax=Biomphalaria pfeifferi TaxID=112525 RepID=A0AAD8AQA3_BIOPF|nr:adenosine deaminase 2 [Biomphalaria pfeifferi]